MAKFCEGCPNMGECIEDITGIYVISQVAHATISEDRRSASLSIEYGVPQGPTDLTFECRDAKGRASERVSVYGDTGTDAERKVGQFVSNIDECPGPMRVKKLFGLVTKKICSAEDYSS